VSARAARAADEFAASLRALQMDGLSVEQMSEVVGLPVDVLRGLLRAWGLDR
jgi:hypothetical protein